MVYPVGICCNQQVFSKKQSCRMDSGALGRNRKVLDRTQQPYRAEEAEQGKRKEREDALWELTRDNWTGF